MSLAKHKVPLIVLELVRHELHRTRMALKTLSLTRDFAIDNPQDRDIRLATMRVRESAIEVYQQFLNDFGGEQE